MSPGRVKTGGVVSKPGLGLTLTTKVPLEVFPAESLAVTVTVVVPAGNADPLAWL
jgi:hypothetical protein